MKALRLTEEELAAIQKRAVASGAKVTTKVHKGPSPFTKVLLKDIEIAGLPEPVTEHRFHPTRKWRFDLAFLDEKIAIEIEGGIWAQGRHNRPAGMEADMEKYNQAQILGWTVLRYSPGQIKAGLPIEDLKMALR